MIPAIFHTIWFGPAEPSRYWFHCRDAFYDLHPDWRFVHHVKPDMLDHQWLDPIRAEFMRAWDAIGNVGDERRRWAYRADLFRIVALHATGGFYVDGDLYPIRPFDRFRKDDLVLMEYSRGKVGEGVIGSAAHSHKLWTILRGAVKPRVIKERMNVLRLGEHSRANGWPSYPPTVFCPHPRINPDDLYAHSDQTAAIHLWHDQSYDMDRLAGIRTEAA